MYISKYVGLDVHKDTISVAYAVPGREDPVSHGVVPNTPKSVQRLISKLSPDGEDVSFCYEAGPCGYGVYRAIEEAGAQLCCGGSESRSPPASLRRPHAGLGSRSGAGGDARFAPRPGR